MAFVFDVQIPYVQMGIKHELQGHVGACNMKYKVQMCICNIQYKVTAHLGFVFDAQILRY